MSDPHPLAGPGKAPDFASRIGVASKPLVPKRHAITYDYTVLTRSLGVGSSGKVLECIQKATGEKRALKILRDAAKSRREVDLHWRCCTHENIVSIIDVYENVFMGHRSLLVVMECMAGGELFHRIQKKGHFTEREASNTVRWICLAVAHLHHMEIAHGDLMPENILFSDSSDSATLKLTDFSFAKIHGGKAEQTPSYTPYYVAPEVLSTEKYDMSCDIWSIGVIAYILICGYPPFYSYSGGATLSPGMKRRIGHGQYSFPDPEWTNVSQNAKDLIKGLLKTNPSERLTIDDILRHPFITAYMKAPETPILESHMAALEDERVYQQMYNNDDAKASLGVTVIMNITNIGTQGYPGTGKTSILDLAMGKEPAPQRNSTGCIDPPSRYMLINSEADSSAAQVEWENVTTDKMFEMVCGAVKKTIEESPLDKALVHSDKHAVAALPVAIDTSSLAANDTAAEYDPTPVGNELVPPTPPAVAGSANQIPAAAEPSLDPYSPVANDGFTWFPDLLKELYSSRSSGVIFNSHWMMVTDCGGQPPFLDAAALFLRNSCLQIFPLKLNESLSNIAEFSYFFSGKSANCDQFDVVLSNQQIMETLAKSTASIQPPYTPSATECPKGAKFTIVGTFEDEARHCSETVAEKETILKQVLEPYKAFRVQLGSKVILPINAVAMDTETKKERTESAKKLRRLLKKANVTMKVEVKLRWFGFLLSMLTIAEKDGKAILTLSECYRLGDSLEMDKSETMKAIQFFHDISLIMHFDTPKLRDSVIIDTKPVLSKLSRLFTLSFLDEDFLAEHYEDIVLPDGAKELLQHHGRFTRSTLESCVEFSEFIPLQFFVDILEHVKIVAAIDQTSEYFMPCALPYATEMPDSSHPWVIRLRVKREIKEEHVPIPVGYLPAILVFLLTMFSDRFFLLESESQRQYRNVIKLCYKPGGVVCLVERHLQLEVHYSFSDQLKQECTNIRNHVLESIRLTEEKLHIREGAITKVDSFLCSCGEGSRAQHICAYNPETQIVECEETRKMVKAYHQLWLGAAMESTAHSIDCSDDTSDSHELPPLAAAEGSDTPTLLKLKKLKGADGKPLKIVQKIAAHDYTTFGMCLLQDENGEEVALIEKGHIIKGAESVTQAILQKWLTSDAPTRTYQHLIECLKDADLGALAELIAQR